MTTHSIIPPSSAGIWGKPDGCTGWVSMVQQIPEPEESQESKDGTASHEIAATLIEANSRALRLNFDYFEGKTATNGVVFTDEMFKMAEIYADDVADIMCKTHIFGGPNFGTEHRIEAKNIHDLSFGTVDQFILDQNNNRLYVWDYKFGYEIIEEFENWQAINYVAGLIDQIGLDGIDDQYITVHIRIAQPRAFHRDGPIREWVVKMSDLREHFNILAFNADKALGPNAECHSGSHCKHCSARHVCSAALTGGMALYEASSAPTPLKMSAEASGVQLGIVRRAKKQLEYLESGFEAHIEGLIKAGTNVPGWMVEQGYGRQKWNKPVGEVIALGKMLDIDLGKPPEAVTPTQAKKLGVDAAVIKAYSETPRTGIKIVSDNGNKAKRMFTS